MRIDRSKVFAAVSACLVLLASASYAQAATFTIGGTVSGLNTGTSVTLLDNGGNALKVTANGSFTFTTALATGATYKVTVGTQPTGETCTVTNGTGTVGTANVTNVTVACKTTYTIGGTVSGLNTGTSVTLMDNGGNALKVTANGSFTFTTALATGAAYKVTVGTQPTGETCTVTGGTGTVGTANVTSVVVSCENTYTIGGTLSGLNTGTSVTLLDNGGSGLKLTANGTFTFKTALATGAAYKVTVGTQPTGQTCTVTSGAGTVGTANVTSVVVSCENTYTIGGTLSGLNTGTSVTLLDNGGSGLKLTANGTFTFKTTLASGAAYKVTVGTQPTGEVCTVTNGTGTVGTANVTNVAVSCATTYTIGGTVSGLNTGTSVTLLDNGGNALKVAANGAFTFTTRLASGAAYKVTVGTQPTGEVCTVTNGTGTVGTANVTNVAVSCATTYTIGGTVSGLNTGTSVTLLDNGGNALKVAANGAFTFTTRLVSGAAYKVTVSVQPTGETCTVTNGTGTVGSANVTTVVVSCAAKTYTIGGTVSGLNTGAAVTLLDNGGDALTVTANGTFAFKTALASGAKYSVTVGTQPTGETCTVTNGSGTVGTANVTNVAVACKSTATFTIGGTISGLNTGASVTLLDNGGDALTVTANGTFTFKTALASGAKYSVTVGTQPTGETCTVTNGSGTVGTANVTNVAVACKSTATFTIGGTVSGLNTGASVTLLDNGGDALTVTANGTFTFKTALASGAKYSVTVGTQPTGETCTVTNGSGTVGTANVTNVAVACKSTATFTIGGTVSGLNTGASVTLLDNGGDALTVTANGGFTFKTALASGASYNVTVSVQPTGETCTVTGGSGTVGTANVTTVKVTCVAKTFTIGGTVSGLNTGASVTLLDNGGDALTVTANGTFTFKTALVSGATYNVTVSVQPTGETCTVTNGSGTVGSANVTNVAVACKATATFTIGGTVSGLNSGTSVTLLDNGGDALTVSANGAFTFKTRIASGSTYNVTVGTEPTGETCTVTNGSGTVGSANVTNVAVACSTGSGGGGAYWIPYTASPVPQATPPGKNGLFLIASDKLTSAPAPAFVTTDNTQLLGIGTQISSKGGVVTYSPQVMMYADTDSTKTTKIFGLTLAGTSTYPVPPTPVQISNLSLPSTQQVCRSLLLGDRRHDADNPVHRHRGRHFNAVQFGWRHLRGHPLHGFIEYGPGCGEHQHNRHPIRLPERQTECAAAVRFNHEVV